MPIYRTRPLANPYVGIDVGYYDRKLMQSQQRHDAAREAWSKNTAAVASTAYHDQAARDQYLSEQDKLFKDVLAKNSGNLSAGLHDVMGALDTTRTNPYLNLNKVQMENIKAQRNLQEKYGAEFIDQSEGLYEPLYQDGKWRDPAGIRAQALQANDYNKVIEDQMLNLSPVITEYTGALGVAPGQPGYLQAVTRKLKELSPEMLQKLANDPRVHQSFLANAPTALQDTRQYGSTGQTFADVLGSQQGFSDFFMGNLIDKVKYESTGSTKFMADKVYAQNQALARDKAKIKAEFEYNKYQGILSDITTINQGVDPNTNNPIYQQIKGLKDLKVEKNTLDIKRDRFGDILLKSGISFPMKEGRTEVLTNEEIVDNFYNNYVGTDNMIDVAKIAANSGLSEEYVTSFINDHESALRDMNQTQDRYTMVQRELDSTNEMVDEIHQEAYDKFYGNLSDKGKAYFDNIKKIFPEEKVYSILANEKILDRLKDEGKAKIQKDFFGINDNGASRKEGLSMTTALGKVYLYANDYNKERRTIINNKMKERNFSAGYSSTNPESAVNSLTQQFNQQGFTNTQKIESFTTGLESLNISDIIKSKLKEKDIEIDDLNTNKLKLDFKIGKVNSNSPHQPVNLNAVYTNTEGEDVETVITIPSLKLSDKNNMGDIQNGMIHEALYSISKNPAKGVQLSEEFLAGKGVSNYYTEVNGVFNTLDKGEVKNVTADGADKGTLTIDEDGYYVYTSNKYFKDTGQYVGDVRLGNDEKLAKMKLFSILGLDKFESDIQQNGLGQLIPPGLTVVKNKLFNRAKYKQ